MRWQYRCVSEPKGWVVTAASIEAWLNSFGQDGWELVQASTSGRSSTYVFKRRTPVYRDGLAANARSATQPPHPATGPGEDPA